jgi:hypothetical protein
MGWALSIDKSDISNAALVEEADRPLEEGEARLAMRRFALTANNITYAAFGEVMRYWHFFPGADGRGRLPVWGFAEIVESRCDGVELGERLYGYFPAADSLIVTPVRIDEKAFMDGAAHRAELPPIYNRYVRCAADAGWAAEREPAQMVLQPLFLTSWLIALHLQEEKAFGADVISLTSASSKTALALAWLLKKTPVAGARLEALTSKGSADFVTGTGLYEAVRLYDDIEALDRAGRYCIVDFAGNGDVVSRLHHHLTDQLAVNIRVGGAHWSESAPVSGLPGPQPQFFFAPDHGRARVQQWGQAELERRYGADWAGFAEAAGGMLDYVEKAGGEGTLEVYRALVAGKVPAREAQVISV